MGKAWSILFGVVMGACGLLCVVSPFVKHWWRPMGVSTQAPDIDFLFDVIAVITGFFFILTEAILVCFMWRYASTSEGKPPTPPPSLTASLIKPVTKVLDKPVKVEMAWTIVPAAILLYIAFAQIGPWARAKFPGYAPLFAGAGVKTPILIDVSARQFEWRMRYPSSDRVKAWTAGQDKTSFDQFRKHPHFDDVEGIVNELHVWKDNPVLVYLSTRDVLHSFNIPHMRVKQDALPGKTIPVWFTPTKANTKRNDETGLWEDGYNPDTKKSGDRDFIWDIACAELCGWGHYRMIGRIYVHETQEDFLSWLEQTEREQNEGKNK